MIPLWYALIYMAGAFVAGYLCFQLWPLTTTAYRLRVLRRSTRMVAELQRLTGAFAPARHRLTPQSEDRWSLPVSPRLTDRDRIDAAKAAAIEVEVVATRALHAAPPPAVIDWHRGERRIYSWGWAVEVTYRLASIGKTFDWKPEEHPLPKPRHSRTVREADGTDTGQFWLIVADLGDLTKPCSHCSAPEDGERPHVLCPGCSCPCGTAPALPEGVDGYAIAGGTR